MAEVIVLGAIGFAAAFVLVWLLSCYIAIGLVEAVLSIPKTRRERRAARLAEPKEPPSTPP